MYEYRFIKASKPDDLERQVHQLASEGWRLVVVYWIAEGGLLSGGSLRAVLERGSRP